MGCAVQTELQADHPAGKGDDILYGRDLLQRLHALEDERLQFIQRLDAERDRHFRARLQESLYRWKLNTLPQVNEIKRFVQDCRYASIGFDRGFPIILDRHFPDYIAQYYLSSERGLKATRIERARRYRENYAPVFFGQVLYWIHPGYPPA